MTTKVLLDLDTGIDDALAICYVLGSPDLELIGITATFGNVSQAQSVSNALSILHLLGRDDIPVYPGASHPLVWSKSSPSSPHLPSKPSMGSLAWANLCFPLHLDAPINSSPQKPSTTFAEVMAAALRS